MILSNQVICTNCGGRPYSARRHDFKYCECENIAVDGGMAYLRRVGGEKGYTDISIAIGDEDCNKLTDIIEDEQYNSLGTLCAIARYMRDEMGMNVESKEVDDESV